MPETLHLLIPGVPTGQPRARSRAFVSASGKLTSRIHDAPKSHAIHTFKATARLVASAAVKGEPWPEPLSVSVQFVFPRPARLCRKRDPAWRLPKVDKPDIDNLLKALLDGLNGVLWADDKQVFQVTDSSKWYAAKDESPKTVLMVTR